MVSGGTSYAQRPLRQQDYGADRGPHSAGAHGVQSAYHRAPQLRAQGEQLSVSEVPGMLRASRGQEDGRHRHAAAPAPRFDRLGAVLEHAPDQGTGALLAAPPRSRCAVSSAGRPQPEDDDAAALRALESGGILRLGAESFPAAGGYPAQQGLTIQLSFDGFDAADCGALQQAGASLDGYAINAAGSSAAPVRAANAHRFVGHSDDVRIQAMSIASPTDICLLDGEAAAALAAQYAAATR